VYQASITLYEIGPVHHRCDAEPVACRTTRDRRWCGHPDLLHSCKSSCSSTPNRFTPFGSPNRRGTICPPRARGGVYHGERHAAQAAPRSDTCRRCSGLLAPDGDRRARDSGRARCCAVGVPNPDRVQPGPGDRHGGRFGARRVRDRDRRGERGAGSAGRAHGPHSRRRRGEISRGPGLRSKLHADLHRGWCRHA